MPRTQGTTAQRGYGQAHAQARKTYLAVLEQNPGLPCWRCGVPLYYESRHLIDLGHDDHDRTVYRGLECRPCNRGTAARRGNRARRHTPPPTSRAW